MTTATPWPRSLLAGVLALLAGCAAPPAPSQAEQTELLGLQLPATVPGTHAAALPEHWWTLYQDPLLERLVRTALAHNRDLATADANARSLLGALRSAGAQRWPGSELGYGYQHGRDGDDQTLASASGEPVRERWQHSASFGLDYQLDLWGEVRAGIAAARADAAAEAAAVDLLRVNVATQTTLAYVQACALARRRDVQEQSLELLRQSLTLNRRQLAAGLGSELERQRLRALVESTRAELPALRARQRLALLDLTLLSGLPPARLDRQAAACRSIPQLSGDLPIGDVWQLLERRPDIREAQRRLDASGARGQLARAELYPRVSFAAGLQSSATNIAGLGAGDALTYAIGPLLSWRFPNRQAALGRIDSADARHQAALAHFDSVVLGALHDVERALLRYAAERERRDSLARASADSQRAFALAELRQRAGAIDTLELLDSQRSLVTLQARLAQAEMAVAERQVDVFRALGGGWQTPEARLADNRPATHHGAAE